jgi:hypothetical protein
MAMLEIHYQYGIVFEVKQTSPGKITEIAFYHYDISEEDLENGDNIEETEFGKAYCQVATNTSGIQWKVLSGFIDAEGG